MRNNLSFHHLLLLPSLGGGLAAAPPQAHFSRAFCVASLFPSLGYFPLSVRPCGGPRMGHEERGREREGDCEQVFCLWPRQKSSTAMKHGPHSLIDMRGHKEASVPSSISHSFRYILDCSVEKGPVRCRPRFNHLFRWNTAMSTKTKGSILFFSF